MNRGEKQRDLRARDSDGKHARSPKIDRVMIPKVPGRAEKTAAVLCANGPLC
jgi:hypothetical protein